MCISHLLLLHVVIISLQSVSVVVGKSSDCYPSDSAIALYYYCHYFNFIYWKYIFIGCVQHYVEYGVWPVLRDLFVNHCANDVKRWTYM